MLSAGKNTPFNNWELQGAVTHTFLNGKVVFDRRELV
jgi:dihydroorotase-like cyclic amidohydrolase